MYIYVAPLLKIKATGLCFNPICLLYPNLVHSYLALFPNRNIAAFLLEHEKWKEMLRSADRESATPLRGLIAFMPGKLNHHYHYTGPLKSEGRDGHKFEDTRDKKCAENFERIIILIAQVITVSAHCCYLANRKPTCG